MELESASSEITHVLRNRRSLTKPYQTNPCLAQGTLDTPYVSLRGNLARVVICNSDLHENPSIYSGPPAIGLMEAMALLGKWIAAKGIRVNDTR